MLRTWRRRTLASGLIFALATSNAAVQGDDATFGNHSTLAPRITPQNLSLDAAIDSMVRRGLLADVKIGPAPRIAHAPQPTIAPQTPPAADGWRPSAGARAPEPAPLTWRAAEETGPTPADPITPTPDLPIEAPAEPTLEVPTLPSLEEPTGPTFDGPVEMPAPQHVASRSDEPATSNDPLPEDQLAPIDELPETPAPATDAPGDPVEPEIGDSQLEGALLPPANGQQPDASSLTGRSLTPVGEPDRIEQPDESAQPPKSAESYQEPEVLAPTRPRRPLNRSQIALREKVRRVLKYYYDHPLDTGVRSPWEVMHCMLSYEVHSRVLKGGPTGEPITAVGWLCFNQPCKGRTLMYLNQDGDMRVKVGPALQGHHGQLLALLAQARVRSDYPMRVEGKEFTVADLIEVEKLTCYPKTELTFKLLGLQRYLELDAKWTNDQGMAWDFPTLLREEMAQPVRTAACGGTHRLSGLILTVKKRQRSGRPLDGEYAKAQRFVADYQNYAYRLQNNDGSFSTEWFKGPGAEEDIDRRLKTTGHQLEFLIYAANDEQLTYTKTVKAVNYLTNIMWANRGRDWEAGPLGHAIHALVLYDRFLFAPHDSDAPVQTQTPVATAQPQRPQPQQQSQRPAQQRGARRGNSSRR